MASLLDRVSLLHSWGHILQKISFKEDIDSVPSNVQFNEKKKHPQPSKPLLPGVPRVGVVGVPIPEPPLGTQPWAAPGGPRAGGVSSRE